MPVDSPESGHYSGIDSLRALAVLSVLLFHANLGLSGGFIGVDVFFVISGFVVSLSVAKAPAENLFSLTTFFYARRLLRIGPALVVCLLATTVLSCLFVPRAWLSETNARTALAAFLGLSNFVLARTANDYFSPHAEFNPFTHTWSLGVEEQFYLVFPLLMFFFIGQRSAADRRRSLAMLTVGSLASLACCAWWTLSRPAFAFYLIPARFWELAVGVGLFMSANAWQPRLARMSLATARRAAGALLVGLACAMFFTDASFFPFPWAIVPVLCTVGLIAVIVACGSHVLPAPLTARPMILIGLTSYSLYLWHWPVLVLFRWTVGLESPAQKVLAVALAFAIAAFSYRYVELPLRYAKRIRRAPQKMVVFGCLAAVTVTLGAAAFLFQIQPKISLSVTADAEIWLPDVGIDLSATAPPCKVAVDWKPLEGGGVLSYVPTACDLAKDARRMFAAGDSHAWAYTSMLRSYSARSGVAVYIITKGGCSLFDLQRPMAGSSCQGFTDAVMRELGRHISSGDILFLPSLRVPRFIDQWGSVKPGAPAESEASARKSAVIEAVTLLQPLAARGALILFEAPKPIFKAPPFRCSDWFNHSNAICAAGFEMDRAALEKVRRPALASIQEVVTRVSGAAVWDPLPTLCPGSTCSAFANGRPLYFDGDHLSGFGNAVLLEAFAERLHVAFGQSQ